MSGTDYKALLEEKCKLYDILKTEYTEFKESSKELETELEADNNQLTSENDQFRKEVEKLRKDIKDLKDKSSINSKQLETAVDKLENENKKLKEDIKQKSRHIIQLEIENEQLAHQTRESDMIITDLESKIDKTLEKLAIVQSELEDNRAQSEEQIERLRQKLRDTESEVFAFKRKGSVNDMSSDSRGLVTQSLTTEQLTKAIAETKVEKNGFDSIKKLGVAQSVVLPSRNGISTSNDVCRQESVPNIKADTIEPLKEITNIDQANQADSGSPLTKMFNNRKARASVPKLPSFSTNDSKDEQENSMSARVNNANAKGSVDELSKSKHAAWRDVFSFTKTNKPASIPKGNTSTNAPVAVNADGKGYKKSLSIVNTLIHDLNSRIKRTANSTKTNVPFAYISQVAESSPAHQAGLKINDMIVEFAGVTAEDKEKLGMIPQLLKDSTGQEVVIKILRKYNTAQSIDKSAMKLVNYNQENYQIIEIGVAPQAKGYLGCKILTI